MRARSRPSGGLRGLPERGPGWWSLAELAQVREQPRLRRIWLVWGAAVALSVATGVANVVWGWNGIEASLFGLPWDLTIYPPFVISVLLALWIGPTWAGIAIYLANLASALTSGMAWPMAGLFALAGAAETLMLWASLVALRVDPNLSRTRDFGWFAASGLVSAATASLAAILWNSSHGLDPVAGQRVWRGWVIGDLLQLLLVVLPLLRLVGPRVRRWVDRQFVAPPRYDFSYLSGVGLTVAAFTVLCAVVFLGVHQALASIEIAFDVRTASGELLLPRLREIVLVLGFLSAALIVATGMFSTALARQGERQRREAQRDLLTGCLNRRAFEELFHKEAERSRRLGRALAVIFADLDHFKHLNDLFGHAVGDYVLQVAAQRAQAALRETDLLFRWGGEELLVVMPHTDLEEARGVAERILRSVADEAFEVGGELPEISITASFGVAASAAPVDAGRLVALADAACYEAKRLGRGRVEVAVVL